MTAEYYKSLHPSQLFAERGSEFVVINPGSANLRMGLASWQLPVTVPHCIAWHIAEERNADREYLKGAVREQSCRELLSPLSEKERNDSYQMVQMELGINYPVAEHGLNGEPGGVDDVTCRKFPTELKDIQYPWTDVRLREDQTTHQQATTLAGHGTLEKYRKYVCGEEALRIPANEPFFLRRPLSRGRFNVSKTYSMQQVCGDLSTIWNWVLTERLFLPLESRQNLSVLLVAPDTLDNREVKEMLSILLKDLKFHSAVVHQECIAATFGNGVPSACVVNLGAQVTTITCVEEGVAIPTTRLVLPYGGEDITRTLFWVQKQCRNWPPIQTDPLNDPLDFLMLNQLKEVHCAIMGGGHHVPVEVYAYTAGLPGKVSKVTLTSVNIPPMGYFHPALLGPEELKCPSRSCTSRHYTDHEDMLDDVLDLGKRAENLDQGLGNVETPVITRNVNTSFSTVDSLLPLHLAIVNSILSAGRLDIQMRFFSNIQLIGGVASTKGLPDAVEERVLHAIPPHEPVDRVEVLPSRVDPSITAWKGGVVLGLLDFTRDSWIQYEDWMDGGVRIGVGRKYKDSIPVQAFWYNAVLES